jgi:hypothetical protein
MGGLETMAKVLMVVGGGLLLLGGLVWLLSKVPFLEQLPGDVRIERPGFTCIVPLVSSILLSILLTVLLNVVVRILKR